MLKVTLDTDQLQQMINDAVDQAIERHALKEKLPPVLTKTEFQELMGISHAKASQLINSANFPVTRDMGHPKINTAQLLLWLDEHTDWSPKDIKSSKKLSIV
ncbi:DNA-binding protein [Halobacillus litoralis]|uniref:Uncharacterized protein n=1 Tax=Halobacillus litoralis TaxID=45668 RepID=A0A410MDS3_9BACI|nr:DNA-binding protein [Halobacillus litoralis]QAS52838.1 hypothetical protein HLI_11840 [Halobacillus litoralis]